MCHITDCADFIRGADFLALFLGVVGGGSGMYSVFYGFDPAPSHFTRAGSSSVMQ